MLTRTQILYAGYTNAAISILAPTNHHQWQAYTALHRQLDQQLAQVQTNAQISFLCRGEGLFTLDDHMITDPEGDYMDMYTDPTCAEIAETL